MMPLRHGWGSQSPQTASHIHIRHIESVLAHWYAVYGHMAVASNSFTQTTWLIFWGSGSLVESKWCHYIIVEADSNLKLLSASTFDTYKVFEHIDMLFWGIRQQPQTVILTLLVGALCSNNDRQRLSYLVNAYINQTGASWSIVLLAKPVCDITRSLHVGISGTCK